MSNSRTDEPWYADVQGLSDEQVQAAVAAGDINRDAGTKTRSIGEIFRSNICTLFNFVNVVLFGFVLFTGSLKNGLFMIIIVLNICIGIVQEIRSKAVTDKLSIVASSKTKVIRAGKLQEIDQFSIVRGDCILLGRGDQIPCDSVVVKGTAKVDESLLTGESDLIGKTEGSQLMSGSFVSSGSIVVRVEHVGEENYAAQITAEAKKHKPINSEIMKSLNGIVKFVSFALFPVGIALFCSTYFLGDHELNDVILSTVAALVGMVPEGLILLTSGVLALAVIRLAKHQVLVQQLYCIETLARVDTLCLDKTGTITSGEMEVCGFDNLEPMDDKRRKAAQEALLAVACADPDPNDTARAILAWGNAEKLGHKKVVSYVPFSSERKWSGCTLEDGTSFVMGAGQFVLKERFEAIAPMVAERASQARVLVLAQVDGFNGENIVGTPRPLALVSIRDQIRASAAQTIGFFKEQGVDVKVISGDDPRTVSGIAQKVGVTDAENYVDATTLKTDEDIADAIGRYHIFGRVKPEQKKAFVKALQAQGHIVAMTGDGVNDTLALKEADCSVAMAAGSDAARNVAQLVLVDNDFSSMPEVVAEGRRSINNLQRSAALFLIKTVFSMVLALAFIFVPWSYPFQPIQMTLVGACTIGLPSFVLALEPNHDRIKGRFLENVIVKSLPGSFTVILVVLAVNILGYNVFGMDYGQVSTLSVLLTAWTGINLIFRISIPFTPIRAALIVVAICGCLIGAFVIPGLFSISPFEGAMLPMFIIAAVAAVVIFNVVYQALNNWHDKRQAQLV